MTSIRIPSELLKSWFEKEPRYLAVLESETFNSEVNAAYKELEKKAAGKVKIKAKQKFAEYAESHVIVGFTTAVAEAYFSGKSLKEVEEETIFNSDWISEQVNWARRITGDSIQVQIWEKNRKERGRENGTYFDDEGEGCWND